MKAPRPCAPVLASERLVLRLAEAPDARALFALYSDRKLMRYWNHDAWTMVEQADRAIAEARLEYARGASMHYVIEQRASRAVIGSCALYDIGQYEGDGYGYGAMLGYLLSPREWGKGYLTEAMLEFLDHVFLDRGLHTVRAQVHPENTASASLLAKLGFLPETGAGACWTVAGASCRPRSFVLRCACWIVGCNCGASAADATMAPHRTQR